MTLLNSKQSETTQLARCAVCKIDLKGRFVYVDDRTAELLSSTKEELFGRSFLEFVGEQYQELVTHLFNNRSHYESFYESTSLGLLTADGEVVLTSAIVSLSFIAGNPVNFQFILSVNSEETGNGISKYTGDPMSLFLDELLDCGDRGSDRRLVEMTQSMTVLVRARVSLVYTIDSSNVSLLEELKEELLATPPPLTPLHSKIAREFGHYSPLSDDAVQNAVQIAGEAPAEYIEAVQTGKDQGLLFRIIFTNGLRKEISPPQIKAAQRAISLMVKVAHSGFQQEKETKQVSNTLLGNLANIGVGQIQIGPGLAVKELGTVMSNYFCSADQWRTVSDLLSSIEKANDRATLAEAASLLKPEIKHSGREDGSVLVKSDNGICLRLHCFTDTLNDEQILNLFFLPVDISCHSSPIVHIHPSILSETTDGLTEILRGIRKLLGKAGNSKHSNTSNAAFVAPSVTMVTEQLDSALSDIRELYSVLTQIEESVSLDINSILKKTIKKKSGLHNNPKTKIELTPSVPAFGQLEKVRYILNNLIDYSFLTVSSKPAIVESKSEVEGRTTIEITLPDIHNSSLLAESNDLLAKAWTTVSNPRASLAARHFAKASIAARCCGESLSLKQGRDGLTISLSLLTGNQSLEECV